MRDRCVCSVLAGLLALSLTACGEATAAPENPLHLEARNLLVEYIRIDTSNPPGNETLGATWFRDLLSNEGIDARLVGSDPARQSVWARLESGSNAPALLLLHHIDVVPADASEWKVPPFAGETSDGYIWGRGSIDDKSVGIAHLMAFLDLHRSRLALRRDIVFLAVADEEAGGLRGAGELLESNPEIFENVGFVINEGGLNLTIVDRVSFWGIEVDQKVPLWLRLTATGEGGHGAAPPADGGAALKLVEALHALQQLPLETRLVPSVERYFHAVAPARPGERGRTLAGIREAMDSPRMIEQLPESYRLVLSDTMVVTRLEAGSSTNSVPSSATGEIDMRLIPGSDPEPKLDEIRALLPAGIEVEVLLSGPTAPASPIDNDLYRILSEEMLASEPGSISGPLVTGGTTDSRFFRRRGVVAYGVSPFKINYYDAAGVHGANERIRSAFFNEGVDLMRNVVRRFCLADAS